MIMHHMYISLLKIEIVEAFTLQFKYLQMVFILSKLIKPLKESILTSINKCSNILKHSLKLEGSKETQYRNSKV